MKKENLILESNQIGRLLFRLSVPAMLGMFSHALYNLVDTVYVGRGIGHLGIAAISIFFPVHILLLSVSQMIGIGVSSIISRALGSGEEQKVKMAFGNLILMIILSGSVIGILGYVFCSKIMLALGATSSILPYATSYSKILLAGSFLFSCGVSLNNVLRSEGKAKQAMISMFLSAILNILLDPLFIFTFGLGIKGAAYATILSQFVSVIYQVHFFRTGSSSIKINRTHLKPDLSIIKEALSIGFSAFIRQAGGSLVVIIVNNTLKVHGGDMSIAIYGIINRLITFTFLPLLGISHGFQPIAGFNYGAKRYDLMNRSLKLAINSTTGLSVLGFLFLFFFPKELVSIFTNDGQLIVNTVHALRIFILATPLIGIQFVGATFFQAIGKALPSIMLSLIRQLVLIPFILILPMFFYLNGVWISFPLADSIGFVITLVILFFHRKKNLSFQT